MANVASYGSQCSMNSLWLVAADVLPMLSGGLFWERHSSVERFDNCLHCLVYRFPPSHGDLWPHLAPLTMICTTIQPGRCSVRPKAAHLSCKATSANCLANKPYTFFREQHSKHPTFGKLSNKSSSCPSNSKDRTHFIHLHTSSYYILQYFGGSPLNSTTEPPPAGAAALDASMYRFKETLIPRMRSLYDVWPLVMVSQR